MKVIAELGINTNGSLDTALRMVEAAAECGCDGVKVQAYEVGDFLPKGHPDWDLFSRNRLSWEDIETVAAEAANHDLLFGATPTSHTTVAWLAEVGVDFLKNGSDFLLRSDLIDAMLDTGIETWVSTGMADLREVSALPLGVKKMACTSLYPCPMEKAGLERLSWADGYSDHTTGVIVAELAAVMGAEMLEKHFTLDREMDGPDHKWSADPGQMRWLVLGVREVESALPYDGSDHVHRDEWRVTETSLRK